MVFTSDLPIFQNATPTLFATIGKREETDKTWDENVRDEVDAREIFDLIKEIRDPQHPMSLEELGYVPLVVCSA